MSQKKISIVGQATIKDTPKNEELSIPAIIVPHHDLVKIDRSEYIKEISQKISPETIILISPNHFDTGSGSVTTTDRIWALSNDTKIKPATELINELITQKIARSEDSAFEREHGIYNILPDIGANFPNASLVPIILDKKMTQDETNVFSTQINKICVGRCLLVVSVDCSHYQPGSLAEIHDSLTLRALNNLDEDLAWQAEVDSRQSLQVFIRLAKSRNAQKFVLKENTNSGKIANLSDVESTSYIFGDYEIGQNDKIENEVSFIVAGDMMLDRNIDYNFRDGKIFDVLGGIGQRLFWGTDLSLVNLEGPISENPILPNNTKDNMIFNFPPKTTDLLNWAHINAAGLANNHTLNNGSEGFDNTRKVLSAKGVAPIGSERNFDKNTVNCLGLSKTKICVLAINTLETSTNIEFVIKEQKNNGNKVLVFPHWGIEYDEIHSASQERLAHSWIDSGADIVIGSHPHVVQDAELYKGKAIFYSLGNFVFDQNFSPQTQRGLIIAGKFKNDSLTLTLLPIVSEKFIPRLVTGPTKEKIVNDFRKMLGAEALGINYGYDTISL